MNQVSRKKAPKMTKIRIFAFVLTVIVVSTFGYIASLYARGFRFSQDSKKFTPNGLLVIKSEPDGAQLLVNGEFKTATNATVPLTSGVYDISVQKEGFLSWNKRITIEKEVVTESTAHLFKSAPSLSALTFSSAQLVTSSRDSSKIAYVVPPNGNNSIDNQGLWIMELINLPLGFAREPKRITDGDLTSSTYEWSPSGREILLTTKRGVYLLDTSVFTPQAQRVNIIATKDQVLADWKEEETKRFETQVSKLPDELSDILTRKASSVVFSPDKDIILYTASGSATLPEDLIKQLPGASTQKQDRDIKEGNTYVYDIKEDRNFLIDEDASDLVIEGGFLSDAKRRISWFPTSRHLVLAEEGKITIMDYDSTNRQEVYAGSYSSPNAFPALSNDRLIILTNLGANSSPTNLYSLSLK